MNKKGNLYAAIMVSLLILLVGLTVTNFIKPEVTNARSLIDCTSPATDGTKFMCLNIDVVVPYFIVIVLSLAGGVITEKFII